MSVELEVARIGWHTDLFGCGVLFGMTLLSWAAAVWFMAAGFAVPALGLGLFMMVLAGCVVDKWESAMRCRGEVRRLEADS